MFLKSFTWHVSIARIAGLYCDLDNICYLRKSNLANRICTQNDDEGRLFGTWRIDWSFLRKRQLVVPAIKSRFVILIASASVLLRERSWLRVNFAARWRLVNREWFCTGNKTNLFATLPSLFTTWNPRYTGTSVNWSTLSAVCFLDAAAACTQWHPSRGCLLW